MSKVVTFKTKKNGFSMRPLTPEEKADRENLWETGFALYAQALGLMQIARESEIVHMGEGPNEALNKAIQLMAEANYERMELVVVDPERISKALKETEWEKGRQ